MSASNATTFWQSHLDTIDSTGESIASYAREHGLSAQSLYVWRSKLRKVQSGSSVELRFAEVVATRPARTESVLLRIGDAVVEFDSLPDSEWLANLICGVSRQR